MSKKVFVKKEILEKYINMVDTLFENEKRIGQSVGDEKITWQWIASNYTTALILSQQIIKEVLEDLNQKNE